MYRVRYLDQSKSTHSAVKMKFVLKSLVKLNSQRNIMQYMKKKYWQKSPVISKLKQVRKMTIRLTTYELKMKTSRGKKR